MNSLNYDIIRQFYNHLVDNISELYFHIKIMLSLIWINIYSLYAHYRCIQRPAVSTGYLSGFFTFLFYIVLLLTWPAWWARLVVQSPCHPTASSLGFQIHAAMPSFSWEYWQSRLRSPCLHIKHCINWATSPAPWCFVPGFSVKGW